MRALLLNFVAIAWTLDVYESCPPYEEYSKHQHLPFSDGELHLSYQRPVPECRTFVSRAVDQQIEDMKDRMSDPDLAQLFENCYPNTLDTTIRWHDSNQEYPRTFVVTGDIDAEWLRDSAHQLSVYMPLLSHDKSLKRLVLGAVNQQAEYVLNAPYCNAFNPPPGSKIHGRPMTGDRVTPPSFDINDVFECKFEIDSLASFLLLSAQYYEATMDMSFMTDRWFEAVQLVYDVAKLSQTGSYAENGKYIAPVYSFKRLTEIGTETLALNGHGFPIRNGTNLIRSAFRPSDDATTFQLFIPGNAMFVSAARMLFPALRDAKADDLLASYKTLADEIEHGIMEYGTYTHPKYGKVFAYEVDGYGGIVNMDDANLPSLLSLPRFGFINASDPLYLNTRKMLLSKDGNPYYLIGAAISGIGGPHVGTKHAWPMSLLTAIMTSDDDEEILNLLKMVKRSTAGLGLMHEGVNVNYPQDYTRSWFAWCNSEFARTILDLAHRKPHLIFKEGVPAYGGVDGAAHPRN
ncbi:glycoside hydrolase family 125 protein [Tortispora caseinolytica NRRL Y-17796]|uniref:Glycoside hydrolase family 125 protein n=1 Tax=Tortispora caseinolytica NRRL Y-17796 TaxID=767744 RepID=A0A1E4TC43_9ASCO|nr:glycoside hydrolase family 125 protein [Tortispora caseinolytica NRRL Y-17796]